MHISSSGNAKSASSQMTAPPVVPSYTVTSVEEIFPRLTDTQIARVSPRGRVRHFERGEVLIPTGEPTSLFFVLLSGTLEVVQGTQSGETMVRVIFPREFTGEVSILSGRPMIVTGRTGAPGLARES